MKRLTVVVLLAVMGLAFMVTDAREGRPAAFDFQVESRALSVFDGDDDDDDDDARPFQVAFTSRVATDRFQADGSSLLLGYAESLQAPVPGVVLGDFEEVIGALCVEEVDLPECPAAPPGSCLPICDTVTTAEGSLTYQALVMVLPGSPNGPFSTTSIYGKIVGGTGAYAGATGDMTLAGRISVCTSPGDGTGCAMSDGVPEELGLRYDCNFILRGVLGGGEVNGD